MFFVRLILVVIVIGAPTVRAEQPSWPPTVATGARLELVYQDKSFFEGPTWDPKTGRLYFTSFKGETTQILRLDGVGSATVWMDRSGGINGTSLGLDGRLLGARTKPNAIVSMKIGPQGPEDLKVVAASETWNGPNDVCQTARGDIYFTDPDFQKHEKSTVYRINPHGGVTVAVKDTAACNGIAASRDGRTLYVGDSFKKNWLSYPIAANGSVGAGKIFFAPQSQNQADPDGLRVDELGNLYLTGLGHLWVASPDGKQLGAIPVPEFCSNLTFGESDGKTLFVTCAGKVYRLRMKVRGAAWASGPTTLGKIRD